MNRRFLPILNSIILFCQCGQKSNSIEISADNLIIEGQGVGQFRVGRTKLDDIVKTLGSDYEEIEHEDLRIEANYRDRGISFYYQNNDGSKAIYAAILKQPLERLLKG